MTRLDIAWEMWQDVNQTYAKNSNGMSKIDFLKRYVSDSARMALREAVMSDFIENDENTRKLNELFTALEDVATKVEVVSSEPEDLYAFVWGMPEQEVVNLSDFTPFVRQEFCDESSLLRDGYGCNVYTVHDGVVECKMINPNSDSFVHFETDVDVVLWLYRNEPKVDSSNSFISLIYAFVLNALKSRKQIFPITFTREPIDALKGESTVKLSGTFYTLQKREFACDASVIDGIIFNQFSESRVVVCA